MLARASARMLLSVFGRRGDANGTEVLEVSRREGTSRREESGTLEAPNDPTLPRAAEPTKRAFLRRRFRWAGRFSVRILKDFSFYRLIL